jgi:hypothetical protein
MAVVDRSGVVCRLREDAVGLVVRVVGRDELAAHGDRALAKISQSPSTVEVVLIPLVEVVRKLGGRDSLSFAHA